MMTRPTSRLLMLLLAVRACSSAIAEQPLVVDEMVVVLIDAVSVPARQGGVIAEMAVREGDWVKAGQELARLDDRKARLEESLAQTRLQIATRRADSSLAIQLAEKKLDGQRQLARRHEVTREIANQKADNDVRVLASQKAQGVAKNELDRAMRARARYVDSVSKSEIDGLRLAFEQTKLETQQADFERRLDRLHAHAEDEAAKGLALDTERLEIEVAQATADQDIEQLQAELQRHQSQLAELATSQHRITSPLSGVVVERFFHPGEWVNPGDPVIRVIRMDRLRAEGYVRAEFVDRLTDNRSVQLTIDLGGNRFVNRPGEIVFISPEIDPVNNETRFWVEFDNENRDVLPGMRLNLRSKS